MQQVTDKKIWMNPTLISNLNTIVYNVRKDFSPLIIISGNKKTRVGKTMQAQHVGYYLAYMLKRPFGIDNVVFSGAELMEVSKKIKRGVFILDETRASLSSTRVMTSSVQELIDFFSETGVYNNVVILVLPDFFDLPKSVAVGLGECLINCFVSKKKVQDRELGEVLDYKRGYYGFWGDKQKNKLYEIGLKTRNYDAIPWNFWGQWNKQWIINEEEYNAKKMKFIGRERDTTTSRAKLQRDIIIKYILEHKIMTQNQISSVFEKAGVRFTQQAISFLAKKTYKIQNTKYIYNTNKAKDEEGGGYYDT